jgi:muramoyltetrapeptide carboxypeptidase LdcA involved in peptidoglycan recycling
MTAQHLPLISPFALRPGDTIGVFTPSSPAYLANQGLFENGIRNLERLGFRVRLGQVTEVDCGHTVPMITLPQEVRVRARLVSDSPVLEFLEAGVETGGNPSGQLHARAL